MASTLYRMNGDTLERVTVSTEAVPRHFQAGWSGDKPEDLPAKTVDPDQLSNLAVREAAKEANIEGYDTKRINTLKSELEDDNEDRENQLSLQSDENIGANG